MKAVPTPVDAAIRWTLTFVGRSRGPAGLQFGVIHCGTFGSLEFAKRAAAAIDDTLEWTQPHYYRGESASGLSGEWLVEPRTAYDLTPGIQIGRKPPLRKAS